MADFWNECFDPAMNISPKEFGQTFCRVCRNIECERSAASGFSWLRRMKTQTERLFDNPTFADPDDPQYEAIRRIDFAQVTAPIEVHSRPGGGDWKDLGPTPAPVLPRPKPPTPPPVVAAKPPSETAPVAETPVVQPPKAVPTGPAAQVLREMHVRGSGETYRVALERQGDEDPEWTCECRAFKFGSARPCKHIVYAASQAPEEEQLPTEPTPPAGPPPSKFQNRPPGAPAPVPPVMPRLPNIPVPAGGVMIDGSKPPPPTSAARTAPADPWSATPTKPVDTTWTTPKKKDVVVPVGGKVVLGGKKP